MYPYEFTCEKIVKYQITFDSHEEMLLRELQLGEIWDFDERKFIQENKIFEVAK